jgi:hypothetical protein
MERRHDQDQTDKTQDTRWRRFEAALVETAAATSSTHAHIPLCSYFLTFSHSPPLSLQQTSHLLIFDHLSRFVSRFLHFSSSQFATADRSLLLLTFPPAFF